jgi:hypothetical protein
MFITHPMTYQGTTHSTTSNKNLKEVRLGISRSFEY